jgi:hypothetical protein
MTALIRKAALTAAGVAFVGGAVAGPITTAYATPTTATPAAAQGDRKPAGEREVGIRYEAQPNFYYCGPASTRIALTAQGKTPTQDQVAKDLGTTEAGTNSAEDITRVLNKETGDKYKTTVISAPKADDKQTGKLAGDIVTAIDNGRAVVANIAGTATDTDGVSHSYEGGHYLNVVGYRDNGKTVKIADPANPDQASYWLTANDLANWIATRGYSS